MRSGYVLIRMKHVEGDAGGWTCDRGISHSPDTPVASLETPSINLAVPLGQPAVMPGVHFSVVCDYVHLNSLLEAGTCALACRTCVAVAMGMALLRCMISCDFR